MGRKKQWGKSKGINKKELSNSMLAVFSNHPRKIFNYKQIAAQLLITDQVEKILITEVLNELKAKEALEEIQTGRYRLKEMGGHVIGKVRSEEHTSELQS